MSRTSRPAIASRISWDRSAATPAVVFILPNVVGVVSKEASIARAQAAGCDAVVVWGACDLPAEVAKLTDGQKAHVIYDRIGKLTFAASLDCLRPRGMMVSFGASSGAQALMREHVIYAGRILLLSMAGKQ
jgi:NADPH2:quinone reductase